MMIYLCFDSNDININNLEALCRECHGEKTSIENL